MHLLRNTLLMLCVCLLMGVGGGATAESEDVGIWGFDQWQFGDAPLAIDDSDPNWICQGDGGIGLAGQQVLLSSVYETDVWYEMSSSRYKARLYAGYIDDELGMVVLKFDESTPEAYELLCSTLRQNYQDHRSVVELDEPVFERLRLVDTRNGAMIIAALWGQGEDVLALQFLSGELVDLLELAEEASAD